tara:strand:- start:372 stop:686 length:315 start_codon:yes stop_codon:yes gene_type:complete
MEKYKILISIIFINLILSSCGSLSNQKKNNSEEFLIEKKSPLSMPPDFEKLPKPTGNQITEIKEESNNVEDLIKGTLNQNNQPNVPVESPSNLEESIIEKIKNN